MARPIHFIIHSKINAKTIPHSVGMPEYSYYFVLRDFQPLLQKIGTVEIISNPSVVDEHWAAAKNRGDDCLFLNFTAPQNMASTVKCPTSHVFAWEFHSIPTESWLADGLQDWRFALQEHQSTITHSAYAADAIKAAMGEDYPVAIIPCPVWDNFAAERDAIPDRSPVKEDETLFFMGRVFDTEQIELFVSQTTYLAHRASQAADPAPKPVRAKGSIWRRLLSRATNASPKNSPTPAAVGAPPGEDPPDFSPEKENALRLNGVVYTSIYNPLDDRKNWQDMISAFVWAHKSNSDATLVLKTPKLDLKDFMESLVDFLKRFLPFNCRIIVLKAFLGDRQYRDLMCATTYYVNTSYAEGQCLPLMEYLSAGVPAIAPASTALADYINDDIAFVAAAHAQPSTWQHDPRQSYRTICFRVDWLALVDAFEQSYATAKADPGAWRSMGQAAADRLEGHCSLGACESRLRAFLEETAPLRTGGAEPLTG
ncbi:MAG: glycosyltransferase [Pseudomonadota bacterium]